MSNMQIDWRPITRILKWSGFAIVVCFGIGMVLGWIA